MIRFTLKCHGCGKIVGYMSLSIKSSDAKTHILTQVVDKAGETEPICCPACEVERLTKEMSNAGLS